MTILLVEQNARAALEVADYGYVLETGEIALEGPAPRTGPRPARHRDLSRQQERRVKRRMKRERRAAGAAATEDDAPRPLDHGALDEVLGYQLSLADVPSKRLYFKHIGTPFRLRPVEYSLLVLVLSNGNDVTQKQLGQALSCRRRT